MIFDGCLLAGSDGLFNYVNYQALKKLMGNKIKTAEDIAGIVSRCGKQLHDDLSVVLIEKT
jgi:hypothetical protein